MRIMHIMYKTVYYSERHTLSLIHLLSKQLCIKKTSRAFTTVAFYGINSNTYIRSTYIRGMTRIILYIEQNLFRYWFSTSTLIELYTICFLTNQRTCNCKVFCCRNLLFYCFRSENFRFVLFVLQYDSFVSCFLIFI